MTGVDDGDDVAIDGYAVFHTLQPDTEHSRFQRLDGPGRTAACRRAFALMTQPSVIALMPVRPA